MAEKLIKIENENWWLGALAGFSVSLFGIVALFWPGLTLVSFVTLFSVFVLVGGIVSLVRGFTGLSKGTDSLWWAAVLYGILLVGIGVFLVRHPNVSFQTMILLIGFTFLAQGVVDFARALFGDMAYATARTMALLSGILGVLAGVFTFTQPEASGVAFVWVVGLYALVLGPLMIAAAIDERPEHS